VDSERRFQQAARPFGLVAALILVFMMLLTVVAVLSRQLFDVPVLGLVELSELALVACIFGAMPGVFLRDENIVVDVVDHLVPRRVIHILRMLGLVLALAFLGFTAVTMIEPAWAMFSRDRYTLVLELDLYYFWIPILFGFFLASAATLWLIVHRLIHGDPADISPSDPA
jgi:TRAP-type C4-dicarboxylate transport system permease small subunit